MVFNPDFMQLMNGVLAIVTLWVLLIFGSYIRTTFRNGHRQRVGGALAIFAVFAGEFVIRTAIWLQRVFAAHEMTIPWPKIAPFIFIGAGVLLLGSLSMIRAFSPEGKGGWFTLAALGSAVVIVTVVYFL